MSKTGQESHPLDSINNYNLSTSRKANWGISLKTITCTFDFLFIFCRADEHALDLMEKLLALNPSNRLSAEEALKHDYFKSQPLPCKPDELPKIEGEAHELTVKKDLKKLKEI